MPVYTYQCNNCGVRFERLQNFSDRPLTRCPECRKRQLRKVFVPAGIIFKGSGWYATDHRSRSGRASEPSGDSPDPKPKTQEKAESKSVPPAEWPALGANADDHTMVRRWGLATFLKAFDDLELAGEAASGDAATQPPALGHDLTERERAVLAVRHGLIAWLPPH